MAILKKPQRGSKANKSVGVTDIPARVKALYGQPGFETWEKIADVLRIPRSSAWSLARGLLREPSPETIEWLECAEFRIYHLEQAANNLAQLGGYEPVVPTIIARHRRKQGS